MESVPVVAVIVLYAVVVSGKWVCRGSENGSGIMYERFCRSPTDFPAVSFRVAGGDGGEKMEGMRKIVRFLARKYKSTTSDARK